MILLLMSLAVQFAPCESPPEGMACVPGGPAVIGSKTGPRIEKPQRTIELSTYYIDKKEVTHGEYKACVAAGACKKLKSQGARYMSPFVGDEQPATPVDWRRARSYCLWKGKRLPSEFEWEKAARGDAGELYPWGNNAPTCDKAIYRECAPKKCKPKDGKKKNYDCDEHATQKVGSFPAGRFGIFDMAGNGYEWTDTWAVPWGSCGKKCKGTDPLGPCNGAYPCPKHTKKVLKGGSWYWPQKNIRGAHRRFSAIDTGSHRLSFRCASTRAPTPFPPKVLSASRSAPALPSTPNDDQLKSFKKVRTDDTMKKEPCAERGRAFLDCRDPQSYVKSNEPRQYLWKPYIENLGGGYVGVGSDQQYSFIGLQRPEWAWLFDYDPQVIDLHHVYEALIVASESPEEFVSRFEKKSRKASVKIILDHWKGNKERWKFRETYLATRWALIKYHRKNLKPPTKYDDEERDATFGWLRNRAHYDYVRGLYQQGRIVIRDGDMLARRALFDIGTSAKKLGVTVKVYYPSNAPELWYWTRQYRKNVRNLPFDDDTVVLQTTSGLSRRGQTKRTQGYWHYNVMGGLFLQERMKLAGYNTLRKAMDDHIIADDKALSVSGLK